MRRSIILTLTILLMARTAAAETITLTVPDPASIFMLGWGAAAAVFRRQVDAMRLAISATRQTGATTYLDPRTTSSRNSTRR
jgi:hypothetical protein